MLNYNLVCIKCNSGVVSDSFQVLLYLFLIYCQQVEGLVLIDLDIGHIQVCPTLSLPRMPSGPAEVFTMAIQQTRRHVDWLGLSR